MSFFNAGDAGSSIHYLEKYDRLAHIQLRRYKILLKSLSPPQYIHVNAYESLCVHGVSTFKGVFGCRMYDKTHL